MVVMDGKILLALLAVLVIAFSSGCLDLHLGDDMGDQRIGVVVSILPLAEFVEAVGGDRVEVSVMVPPGASPHTYEPKASQLRAIKSAEMYVMVGSGLEFETVWMERIVDLNHEMLVVNSSDGVEIVDHNPHVWLSLRNARVMVENIYHGLARIDPENQEYYARRMEGYQEEIDKVDALIRANLSDYKKCAILVYHPAWAYFARDYGLEEIAIEEDGKRAGPKRIAEVVGEARARNITLVFASPHESTRGAEMIAEEIGGEVALVDPLAYRYLENMNTVAEAFRRGAGR